MCCEEDSKLALPLTGRREIKCSRACNSPGNNRSGRLDCDSVALSFKVITGGEIVYRS